MVRLTTRVPMISPWTLTAVRMVSSGRSTTRRSAIASNGMPAASNTICIPAIDPEGLAQLGRPAAQVAVSARLGPGSVHGVQPRDRVEGAVLCVDEGCGTEEDEVANFRHSGSVTVVTHGLL